MLFRSVGIDRLSISARLFAYQIAISWGAIAILRPAFIFPQNPTFTNTTPINPLSTPARLFAYQIAISWGAIVVCWGVIVVCWGAIAILRPAFIFPQNLTFTTTTPINCLSIPARLFACQIAISWGVIVVCWGVIVVCRGVIAILRPPFCLSNRHTLGSYCCLLGSYCCL